ncbi:MAG: hypothetical protein EO766_16990 [Hydrotalea sp. AMD]|uniref:hypothetical protein n=1 Tax=Hydrotalea sp. AMD TaxID=2501297 RepID=UPI0010283A1D|nr:hypothetical protein [Hydrotalea sp. AMD]RWZ84882.1 MAG: hypothetical protein EO766_16990 [Hydrotalea sp. AMD]
MNEKELLYFVGGAVIVFLFMHSKQNGVNNSSVSNQAVQPQQTPLSGPVLLNGQPYYNLTFTNNGNVNNPLAQEYMPLFGFVGMAQGY